ncbi:MAG TPA: hypothetical protein VFI28_13120 [Candidatus Limnocylindrales bacterium]|nr:hypothetical protein [Candidatus Limnocylindrales bacterium]
MEAATLLSTVAFVALALAVVAFTRRAGRVLGETREAESFRRSIADLTGRAEQSLGAVSARIDALRRHQVTAPEIEPNVAAAIDAVARYATEARGLRPPAAFVEHQTAIGAELERAHRALEMVAHGCAILGDARPRGRELEAQTSIKRGYVNVLHARDAITHQAAAVAVLRTPHEARAFVRRPSA